MSPIITGLITTYLNTPATVKGQCRRLGPKDYIRSFTDVFRYTTILKHTVQRAPSRVLIGVPHTPMCFNMVLGFRSSHGP